MNSGYNSSARLSLITAFLSLTAVGITGVWMRSMPWFSSIIPYENLLHAHSHTALLGWAFLLIIAGLSLNYNLRKRYFRWNIAILILSVAGMFFSFLYQSYGAVSISFSALFVISAYILLSRIFTQLKGNSESNPFIQRSIIWFFISTIGIWLLGPASAFLGKEHWLYDTAIHFFLHFQINGWLVYATLGFILDYRKIREKLIYLLDASLILTGFLPFFWIELDPLFYYMNATGVVMQMFAIIWLCRGIFRSKKTDNFQKFLLSVVIISLILKGLSQLTSVIPQMAESVFFNRNLILTFLHLVLIGFVSTGLIFNALKSGLIVSTIFFRTGFYIFTVGFFITELILLFQGMNFYTVYNISILFLFSAVMLVGILIMTFSVLRRRRMPV